MSQDKTKIVADASVEEKLSNLYKLQKLVSEIDNIKTLRGELPLEVQDLEDEVEGLTTRIEKIQAEESDLQHEINSRKNDNCVYEQNIERYKEQLKNVRNNREYDSLNKQIELQELDIELNNKKMAEAKERKEEMEEEIKRCSAEVGECRADLEIKKSELEEVVAETKAGEEKLREQAKNLETLIEPRLLAAFKRIRKNSHNGLAVVYVQRNACGGCFNKIPPQRQLDIRMRKKIIVCEYCGRIMVDPELAGVETQAPVEEKPKRRTSRRKAAESAG